MVTPRNWGSARVQFKRTRCLFHQDEDGLDKNAPAPQPQTGMFHAFRPEDLPYYL